MTTPTTGLLWKELVHQRGRESDALRATGSKPLSILGADTDSLYIDLSCRPSAASREISEGVVLDYDADGCLVGIDIDNASARIELDTLVLSSLPGKVETAARG